MPSGSAEPDCCKRPLLLSPELENAATGADELAGDAPGAKATKLVARATIHQTVYGTATAAFSAGSTAVN